MCESALRDVWRSGPDQVTTLGIWQLRLKILDELRKFQSDEAKNCVKSLTVEIKVNYLRWSWCFACHIGKWPLLDCDFLSSWSKEIPSHVLCWEWKCSVRKQSCETPLCRNLEMIKSKLWLEIVACIKSGGARVSWQRRLKELGEVRTF